MAFEAPLLQTRPSVDFITLDCLDFKRQAKSRAQNGIYILLILLHSIDYFPEPHLVQDLESLFGCHLCKLYVVVIELLLHDLLQYLQRQFLCFHQRDLLRRGQQNGSSKQQEDYLVPLVLKFVLRDL